jgi:hypothetical protein
MPNPLPLLPGPLQGLEDEDLLPGRRQSEKELSDGGDAVACRDERLSSFQPVRPIPREELEEAREAVAEPPDQADGEAASAQ